ncbi:hypothetical protein FACS1894147_13020 [Spirochaetia bacterium]|nr:hypothetical protein FACS1894147_13020 [Spirochaetia bacterium]
MQYTLFMSELQRKLSKLGKAFGSLLLDGSKLCFGSLVLGSVIRGEIALSMLMSIGIVVSAVAAVLGLVFVTISED